MSKRTLPLPTQSYYKRILPPSCVSFDSPEGKKLFRQALDEGNMESYFSLSMQYLTQSEPAFCGLGTLCMVLNALGVDPLRQWKGVWRWYDETMLDCCRPLDEVKQFGITLPEFVCIARCNRLKTQVYRAEEGIKEKFIQDVKVTAKSSSKYIVVSYDRGTLGQTGTGHFSPIGGYCEKENMVLIMDVARFKYPAYWVSIDLVWDALAPIDSSTGKSRGYCVLSKGKKGYAQSAISQLACNKDSWHRLANILFKTLPKKVMQLDQKTTVYDFLSLVISSIPDKYYSVVDDRLPLFVTYQTDSKYSKGDQDVPEFGEDGCGGCSASYIEGLDDLLQQLYQTELYKMVSSTVEAKRKLKNLIHETEKLELQISPTTVLSPHLILRSRKSLTNVLSALSTRQNSFSGGLSSLGISMTTDAFNNEPNKINTCHLTSDKGVNSITLATAPTVLPNKEVSNDKNTSDAATTYSVSNTKVTTSTNSADGPALSIDTNRLPDIDDHVNDFIAFLTIFLFALFSYCPSIYENISFSSNSIYSRKLVDQIRDVVNLRDKEDSLLKFEIEFLKNQIAALTELVENS